MSKQSGPGLYLEPPSASQPHLDSAHDEQHDVGAFALR